MSDRGRGGGTAARGLSADRALRILQAGGVGGFDWDLAADEAICSPLFYELYGFPPDKPTSYAAWRERLHADDVARFDAQLATALRGGERFECEFRAHRLDTGEARWFVVNGDIERDDSGRAVRMVGAHVDVTDRKCAEARQRASDLRYRTILEETTDFVVATDLDQRITVCNRAAARALGLTPDEVIGRSLLDFIGAEEFERTTARLGAKLAGGGSTQYELTVYDTEGRPQRWEINSSLSRDPDGRPIGLHVLARDMSAARAMQAALATSEERLRLATAGAGVGLWDWDLVTMLGWWSPRTAEIMGVASGESITPEQRLERVHPDDRERLQSQLLALLMEGDEFAHDYRIVRPDGHVRWISSRGIVSRDAAGRAVRTTGTVIDVTEDREAGIRLRESEARLRRAQEAGAVGSYEWDVATGSGQQSDSMLHIIGLEPGRTYSLKSVTATVVDDDRPAVMATVAAIGAGAERAETDYRIRRPDGEIRWIRDIGQLERDGEGRPVRWVGIIQDVTARKIAELALAKSEERLRLVQRAGAIGSFDWEIDAGTIVRSPEYLAIHGLPADATDAGYSDRWFDRIHPDDRAHVEAMHRATLVQPGDFANEHRIIRVDNGETRWVSIRGTILCDAKNRPYRMVAAQTDVTDRKRAEEQLRESETRLRLAQNAGGIGLWDWNLDDDTTWWSDKLHDILGLPLDAPRRVETFLAAIHPDDRCRVSAATEAAIAGDGGLDLEFRVVRPDDGRTIWVASRGEGMRDPDGHMSRVVGVNFDITDRKAAEAAVEERAADLEAVLDAVPAAIWIARDADAQRIDGNRLARDLLRMAPGVNLSKSAPEAVTAVAHFRVLDADGVELTPDQLPVQAAARGARVRDFEETIVFDDGARVDLIGNAVRLTDADGQPRGAVAAFIDVTALKQVGQELRELTLALEDRVAETVAEREAVLAQLHEAQKLETLGQLTGGVAHDFNNLLTPIVGSLDLLRRRLPDDPRAAKLIDGALQAADRAQTLVARLLAFGRRQLLQARPVDVADLLRGLTDLIRRTIGQHIAVVVEPGPDLPAARVDPNQLELAILNLAVNARDAMPGGGTLTITAHPAAVAAGNDERLEPGDYVRLSIIDTGTGMDAGTLKRAIEPFFTTKGIGKGTGLGLSMIHGLAGQLGGALKLSSTVGVGTRVDLWLPVAETAAAPQPTAEMRPARPLPQAATVLLVDDEDLVRMGAAEMLVELGYAVVEAASGGEALRLVDAGQPVHIVVTDYLMPGMNGGELIEALRQRCPALPALIVTGYATVDGAPPGVPTLAKPFRHDDLAREVAAQLEGPGTASSARAAEPAR